MNVPTFDYHQTKSYSLPRMINDKVITAYLVRVDNIISNVTNNELIKQWIGILLFSDNNDRLLT